MITANHIIIGHLYPPSNPIKCQTTGQILDLIASGVYGSITFNDGNRDIQTWVATNDDAEKLFRQIPEYPEGWWPSGSKKVTLVKRDADCVSVDRYCRQQETVYKWKPEHKSSG